MLRAISLANAALLVLLIAVPLVRQATLIVA